MHLFALSAIFCLLIAHTSAACSFTPLANAATKEGYCASVWASGLTSPRGIVVVSNEDVLVVESGRGISVLWEENGVSRRVMIITQTDLNHGIAVSNDEMHIYASSQSTVYRWPYKVGTRTPITTAAERVIVGIPTGGHSTRSLIFDHLGRLYVSIGSNANVDPNPDRSGVMRFDVANIPNGGISWNNRHLYVLGTRNEVGLRFDRYNLLWGVENGIDNLNRADLGGDIHNLNPGEELNLLADGKFYGYPYCWSQFDLPAVKTPVGTQYVHPDFMRTAPYSDAWCQDPSRVVKPEYQMQPHTAPLDIIFHYGDKFPGVADGDAFVSQHGSWNRQPPAGYRVIHVNYKDNLPVSEEPMVWYSGSGQTGPGWIRPVGLGKRTCQGVECLLITSDSTGSIVALTPTPNCKCPSETE